MFIEKINHFCKRRCEAVYRGSILYFEFFQASESALKIYNSFLLKNEKQKERQREEVEAKILLIFQVLKEYLRDREEDWGTKETKGAWSTVFVCKIVLLRMRLESLIKKADGNEKIVRETKALVSYLLMASGKGDNFLRKGCRC